MKNKIVFVGLHVSTQFNVSIYQPGKTYYSSQINHRVLVTSSRCPSKEWITPPRVHYTYLLVLSRHRLADTFTNKYYYE